MPFSYVDPRHLDTVWPKAKNLLEQAVSKGFGEMDLSQIKLMVRRSEMQMLVWFEGEEVISAGVVSFIDYPNYRVAHCAYLSGRYTEEAFTALKEWCKLAGATHIQCFTDDAIMRLYKRYGLEKKYNVLRVEL